MKGIWCNILAGEINGKSVFYPLIAGIRCFTKKRKMSRQIIGLIIILHVTILGVSQQRSTIDYSNTVDVLINEHADDKTNALYQYLRSEYGQNIISGQTSYWEQLIAIAGREPLLRAFDFQSYTQGYPYVWRDGGHTFGWHDNGMTQQAINWYKSTNGKGIVTFQWHWHSPSGGSPGTNTFYTWQTDFDPALAISPGTPENVAIIQDIDSIASQLKKLQAANVPVLWRPLHEASGHGNVNGTGAWFWWGRRGAAVCLRLYDIIYDRLTNHHGLNNLIWVWSSPERHWYPGNEKVDILGYDSYPGEYNYTPVRHMFNQLYNIVEGEKIIALTENGPIPDIDQCIEQNAMWSYFCSWSNLVAEHNSPEHIRAVYAHPRVITLDIDNLITVGHKKPRFAHPMVRETPDTIAAVNLKEYFTISQADLEMAFSPENNTNPTLASVFIDNDSTLMLVVYPDQTGSGTADIWASAEGSRSVMTQFEFVVYDPAEKDHLLYQKATSSSIESTNHSADRAIDGRNNTRWSSQYRDNEYIAIEMDTVHPISRMMLHWEVAYGRHYKIEVSDDGEHWTEVFEETCSNGGYDRILFDPIETRHVRMFGVKRATQFGFSLWAMEAYSLADDNTPPVFTSSLPDQTMLDAETATINLPDHMVYDPDIGERLYFSVRMADGNTVPDWIVFDDCTRTLQIIPAGAFVGEVSLRVHVRDMHGAKAQSEPFTITVQSTVNINELPCTENRIHDIYPNPVHDILHVSQTAGIRLAIIMDMKGQILHYESGFLTDRGINIQHLPPGLYVIKLKTGAGDVIHEHFIKY